MNVVWSLVPALWVGSLWTVGYLVAPALFALLPDRSMAGDVAGRLFQIEAWLGLACGALLLGSLALGSGRHALNSRPAWLVVIMMALLAVGEWLVGPVIAGLRADGGSGTRAFAMWHGVSALLYLAASVLGLALLLIAGRVRGG